MKIDLKRVTLNNEERELVFQHKGMEYIVKNFSDSDIYVSFDVDATDEDSILIPSKMGQVCTCGTEVDTIYINGNGEVEVQQL